MKRMLAALVAVVAGVIFVGGVAWYASAAGAEPPVLVATAEGTKTTADGRSLPHSSLELAVYPQAATGAEGQPDGPDQNWPFFSPSTTLQVPANSLVTVRLKMYDGSTPPYNPFLAKVIGTVDGKVRVDGKEHKELKVANVAHSFVVRQVPEANQPEFFLQVPLHGVPPKAKNLANGYPKPMEIEFTFETGDPGSYIWNCEVPCGDRYQWFGGPMSERGFMAGTFEVV